MNKIRFVLGICFGFIALPALAQEAPEDPAAMVHYNLSPRKNPPVIRTLDPSEDDLYDGAEIKPIERQLSLEEKQQENSSDLNYIKEESKMPDLLCSNESLLNQVRKFIFETEQSKPTNSVPEKRARILLVNYLNELHEVSENDIRKDFNASAIVANLKINEHRVIHRICASTENRSKKYGNVYVVIYPYVNYYKVVVTNLAVLPEKKDDATFIFNW